MPDRYWPERRVPGQNHVWVARDVESGEEVIMKRMDYETNGDYDERNQQVHHEATLLRELSAFCPERIVGFRAACTLADVLAKRKVLLEKEAKVAVRAMMEGLAALHKRYFVHRDVKPSNLFLFNKSDLNSLKLGDFGVSVEENGYCNVGGLKGTKGYMAPEVMKKAYYGRPVDMWSAGVVTFEILTGSLPSYQAKVTDAKMQPVIAGENQPAAAATPIKVIPEAVHGFDGWVKLRMLQGPAYYFNEVTGQTQWHHPGENSGKAEQEASFHQTNWQGGQPPQELDPQRSMTMPAAFSPPPRGISTHVQPKRVESDPNPPHAHLLEPTAPSNLGQHVQEYQDVGVLSPNSPVPSRAPSPSRRVRFETDDSASDALSTDHMVPRSHSLPADHQGLSAGEPYSAIDADAEAVLHVVEAATAPTIPRPDKPLPVNSESDLPYAPALASGTRRISIVTDSRGEPVGLFSSPGIVTSRSSTSSSDSTAQAHPDLHLIVKESASMASQDTSVASQDVAGSVSTAHDSESSGADNLAKNTAPSKGTTEAASPIPVVKLDLVDQEGAPAKASSVAPPPAAATTTAPTPAETHEDSEPTSPKPPASPASSSRLLAAITVVPDHSSRDGGDQPEITCGLADITDISTAAAGLRHRRHANPDRPGRPR
ncbi:hypothetical protein HK405_005168 [Cladochytrium tenue]|nr:hypothetical protein HK405_005168 [Cladochytrium tenue]